MKARQVGLLLVVVELSKDPEPLIDKLTQKTDISVNMDKVVGFTYRRAKGRIVTEKVHWRPGILNVLESK